MTTKHYNNEEGIRAIALVGPTASGKTGLSIKLGKRLGGEILGCDSMQIYRYMDIGTAKPTAEERAAVPHHLVDFVSPNTPYSAADYGAAAQGIVKELSKRGIPPIFCGGTGLYLEAARSGRHISLPPTPPEVRLSLANQADAVGAEEMHRRLAEIDSASAAAIHPNNLRRTLRALEIYQTTGKTKSEWDRETKRIPPALSLLTVCLYPTDRDALHRRIDRRVDDMVRAGLRREVEWLTENGYMESGSTASQAIGYKEYAAALRGECTEEKAIEEIKIATHRYARRQLTWFRAVPNILLLPIGEEGPTEADCERVEKAALAHLSGAPNERTLLKE